MRMAAPSMPMAMAVKTPVSIVIWSGPPPFPQQREFRQDDSDIFGEGVHQLVAGLCLLYLFSLS